MKHSTHGEMRQNVVVFRSGGNDVRRFLERRKIMISRAQAHTYTSACTRNQAYARTHAQAHTHTHTHTGSLRTRHHHEGACLKIVWHEDFYCMNE